MSPVSLEKSVWHVGYQDVIAIGHLFSRGKLDEERYVSLAGPRVKNPRILKTRRGANLDELLEGEIDDPSKSRVISGSILNGRTKDKTFRFLGQFDHQISCIEEDIIKGSSRLAFSWG